MVDFVLARGIPAHQALERRRFVRSVVVDVKAGVLGETGHHKIDEPLESRLLVRACERPIPSIGEVPGLVAKHVAEEVFEATAADEGVSLKIEEHVTG